jgi:Arc/MetJ-type ribon-helix-helix transcriptional regulator
MGLPKGRVGTRLTEQFNLKLSAEQLMWIREHAENRDGGNVSQAHVVREAIQLLRDKHT